MTHGNSPQQSLLIATVSGVSLEQQPHLATSALSSYFQAGCTHSTGPLFLSSSTVVQQVLAVGQKLIELHQVAHMHHLLALAGDGACTPGADFLMVSPCAAFLQLPAGRIAVLSAACALPICFLAEQLCSDDAQHL